VPRESKDKINVYICIHIYVCVYTYKGDKGHFLFLLLLLILLLLHHHHHHHHHHLILRCLCLLEKCWSVFARISTRKRPIVVSKET